MAFKFAFCDLRSIGVTFHCFFSEFCDVFGVMVSEILKQNLLQNIKEIKQAILQDHFLVNPDADRTERPPSDFDYKWNVDVTYVTSSNDTVQRMTLGWQDDCESLTSL